MKYIVGLGNPGEEYAKTRHNAGRLAVQNFLKNNNVEMAYEKKSNSLRGAGKLGKANFEIIFPETFMNNSGKSVAYFIKSKKSATEMVIVHDDVDLPLGKIKLSFGRGSGGHKGVESIIRALKTNEFLRVRIGVSKSGTKGKVKKPEADKMNDFIVGNFKKEELDGLKKVEKRVSEILETVLEEGYEKAMNLYN